MINLSKFNYQFISELNKTPITLTVSVTDDIGEKIYIDHLPPNIEVFKTLDNTPSSTIPPLFVRKEKSETFRDINLREQTEYNFLISVPISKKEIKQEQLIKQNPIYPIGNLKLKNYVTLNSSDSWFEKEGVTTISGRFNFKNFIGVISFYCDSDLSNDYFQLEVVSYKITYETDFKNLLNDLSNFHSELILSLDDPTEVNLISEEIIDNVSPHVLILHLKKLFNEERLPLAIETILSNPHKKLNYINDKDNMSFITTPDIIELISNPTGLEWKKEGLLKKYFKGYSPLEFYSEEIENTYDTKENQFIKFSLEEIEKLVLELLNKLPNKFANSRWFLNNCLNIIEEYLQNPLFQQIGPLTNLTNSIVLQRRNGYKEFLQAIQSFELGIQLNTDVSEFDTTNGDLRPISSLYEIWCYFKLYFILKDICLVELKSLSSLLYRTEKGYKLNLKQKDKSCLIFKYKNLVIEFYYNRDFINQNGEIWEGTYDRGVLHPDFSIKIINNIQSHWIHFDSKYKLDNNKLQKMLRGENVQEGNYLRNDIHTAHAYRDAILGTRGVFILYPDITEEATIFIRHPNIKYKQTFSIPSIGAFPLKPSSQSDHQMKELKDFLLNIFDIFNTNEYYQEETGFEK